MVSKITAVLIHAAIGKDAIPSESCRDPNRDSGDKSRCHQPSGRFQKDDRVDSIPEQRYQFSERFVARDRKNSVKVGMVL
jgi:hypothetical protein